MHFSQAIYRGDITFLMQYIRGSIMLIGFITGYVSLDHLVKLVSSRFPHSKVTNFFFIISKYVEEML